jgi:hypothetical protein
MHWFETKNYEISLSAPHRCRGGSLTATPRRRAPASAYGGNNSLRRAKGTRMHFGVRLSRWLNIYFLSSASSVPIQITVHCFKAQSYII